MCAAQWGMRAAQSVLRTAQWGMRAAQSVLRTAKSAMSAAQSVMRAAQWGMRAAQSVLRCAKSAMCAAKSILCTVGKTFPRAEAAVEDKRRDVSQAVTSRTQFGGGTPVNTSECALPTAQKKPRVKMHSLAAFSLNQ